MTPSLRRNKTDADPNGTISQFEARFIGAMDDDFDTEKAATELVDFTQNLVRDLRLMRQDPKSLSRALRSLTKLSSILGVL